MVWTVILVLFLAAIVWLLYAPLRLEIDTAAGIFRVEWRGIALVQWLPDEGLDRIDLRVFFFRLKIPLGRSSHAAEKHPDGTEKPRKKSGSKSKTSPRTMLRLMRNMLRSFEVKRLQVWWDSDDFVWNAQAYPLAQALNAWGKPKVYINFTGQRELALQLENRMGRMIWAALQTFIFNR